MKDYSERVLASVRDGLWSLWTELGVKGVRSRHGVWAIDPEALIVFTAAVGDLDARLRDEATDWCIAEHRLISGTRLKNLVAMFGPLASGPIGEFIGTVNAHSYARLPSGTGPRPFNPRGRASVHDIGRPALLNFRLRGLFGVGARADILYHYLAKPSSSFTASDLAQLTSFTKRRVADTLRELAESGLLKMTRRRNQLHYHLEHRIPLQTIVGALPEVHPNWLALLSHLFIIFGVAVERQMGAVDHVAVYTRLKELHDRLALPPSPLQSPPLECKGREFWPAFETWGPTFAAEFASPAR